MERGAFEAYVFDPLDLRDTYAFRDPTDTRPAPMYYKDAPLHVPRYITSVTGRGRDRLHRARHNALPQGLLHRTLLPVETIEPLKRWNRTTFPDSSTSASAWKSSGLDG
ncbi:MAG: hypothetical protein U5J97_09330 [Trueperaceae bacterium]|nr:hypothetical protein [Trueperaceae bacterium]